MSQFRLYKIIAYTVYTVLYSLENVFFICYKVDSTSRFRPSNSYSNCLLVRTYSSLYYTIHASYLASGTY